MVGNLRANMNKNMKNHSFPMLPKKIIYTYLVFYCRVAKLSCLPERHINRAHGFHWIRPQFWWLNSWIMADSWLIMFWIYIDLNKDRNVTKTTILWCGFTVLSFLWLLMGGFQSTGGFHRQGFPTIFYLSPKSAEIQKVQATWQNGEGRLGWPNGHISWYWNQSAEHPEGC